MGFFKLGRLERGKGESKADKKENDPLMDGAAWNPSWGFLATTLRVGEFLWFLAIC